MPARKVVLDKQLQLLVDYIEQNHAFGMTKTFQFNFVNSEVNKRRWEYLARRLNSVPHGAQKSPYKWKMYWYEKKSIIKKKKNELKSSPCKRIATLSPLEERIWANMSETSANDYSHPDKTKAKTPQQITRNVIGYVKADLENKRKTYTPTKDEKSSAMHIKLEPKKVANQPVNIDDQDTEDEEEDLEDIPHSLIIPTVTQATTHESMEEYERNISQSPEPTTGEPQETIEDVHRWAIDMQSKWMASESRQARAMERIAASVETIAANVEALAANTATSQRSLARIELLLQATLNNLQVVRQ